jgi:hypothetical protein
MIEQCMLKKHAGNYDELWKERFVEALDTGMTMPTAPTKLPYR